MTDIQQSLRAHWLYVLWGVVLVAALTGIAVWNMKPQQAAGDANAATVAAAKIKLAADAVNAAAAAKEAMDVKAAFDKELVNKSRNANDLQQAANANKSAWDNLKAESSDKASAAEKTWTESNLAAENAEKLKAGAEASATQATNNANAAVAAAKKALLQAEAGATSTSSAAPGCGFILLALLLLSPFPLSAVAFMWLEVPSLLAQLKIDYKMLGTQPRTVPLTNQQDTNPVSSLGGIGSATRCIAVWRSLLRSWEPLSFFVRWMLCWM